MKMKMPWIKILLYFILPGGLIIALVFYLGGPIKEFIQGFLNGASNAAKKASEFVGLSDSASQVYVNNNLAKDDNPFSPRFYTKYPQTRLTSYAKAKEMATDIHDAIVGRYGFTLYKDGNQVLGVINSCATQSQVSWVADVFNRTYKADMLAYMNAPGFFRSGLNSDALEKIIEAAKKLPLY